MVAPKVPSDLSRVQELFDFLQGKVPEGYEISEANMPKLTPDQAWMTVYYLANSYWQVPDHIVRCDGCGVLYDTNSEGRYSEKREMHLCESCEDCEEG